MIEEVGRKASGRMYLSTGQGPLSSGGCTCTIKSSKQHSYAVVAGTPSNVKSCKSSISVGLFRIGQVLWLTMHPRFRMLLQSISHMPDTEGAETWCCAQAGEEQVGRTKGQPCGKSRSRKSASVSRCGQLAALVADLSFHCLS